ncbi:MAG: hypothetical protein J2P21_08985 [Chloracidobacterium sp.]|nr:hypothetical protein [Chloracidobacterium sp.]
MVLISGRTFSTAADFCAVAHHLKRATFIGEETGGAYYGNNSGDILILTLPNSKARVGVPLYEYWNAVPGYDGKRRGTRPDLQVETTAANLLRGVDEQLDDYVKRLLSIGQHEGLQDSVDQLSGKCYTCFVEAKLHRGLLPAVFKFLRIRGICLRADCFRCPRCF